MENFQTQYTSEEHGLIITDVRFRPNTNQLATSSFDRTIKLWNAADVSYLYLIGLWILCCTAIIPPIAALQLCVYSLYTSTDVDVWVLVDAVMWSQLIHIVPMALKVTRCNHAMNELAYKYFSLFVSWSSKLCSTMNILVQCTNIMGKMCYPCYLLCLES